MEGPEIPGTSRLNKFLGIRGKNSGVEEMRISCRWGPGWGLKMSGQGTNFQVSFMVENFLGVVCGPQGKSKRYEKTRKMKSELADCLKRDSHWPS